MLQLQTNYSAINVRWAALQVQLDAYRLPPATWRSLSLNCAPSPALRISRSWLGGENDSWQFQPRIRVKFLSVQEVEKSRGEQHCPLCDSEKSGDPVKWYHATTEENRGERTTERCRDRMSPATTSTCGFTGTLKLWVRWMKCRTLKWHTHTHARSKNSSFLPSSWDVADRGGGGETVHRSSQHLSLLHQQHQLRDFYQHLSSVAVIFLKKELKRSEPL